MTTGKGPSSRELTMVDWFIGGPDSTQQAMLAAGIPLLEVIWALIGAIAVVVLAFSILHIIQGIRSHESHLELHQFGETKSRVRAVRKLRATRG